MEDRVPFNLTSKCEPQYWDHTNHQPSSRSSPLISPCGADQRGHQGSPTAIAGCPCGSAPGEGAVKDVYVEVIPRGSVYDSADRRPMMPWRTDSCWMERTTEWDPCLQSARLRLLASTNLKDKAGTSKNCKICRLSQMHSFTEFVVCVASARTSTESRGGWVC